MSMFISKALRRAEVFLEQVDESVAQASRRLVVEGATGVVDEESDDLLSSDEEGAPNRRAATIPRAEERKPLRTSERPTEEADGSGTSFDERVFLSGEEEGDAWGVDLEIEEDVPQSATSEMDFKGDDSDIDAGEVSDVGPDGEMGEDSELGDPATIVNESERGKLGLVSGTSHAIANEAKPEQLPVMLDPVEAMAALPISEVRPSNFFEMSATSATKQPLASSKPTVGLGSEADEYILALQAESTELRKELDLVENDFEKSRRERSKLVKNLKRMKEIVSEMDESLREKSAEARNLEAELFSAKDEISRLHSKSRESDARGKDGMDLLRKELNSEIDTLQDELGAVSQEADDLKEENERLKEALLQGHEVDLATADGARQEASQAHRAYEAETQAHRETRRHAKEREEALEEEAALATSALAAAQRKAEECILAASNAKSSERAAQAKLVTVTSARDAAFARVEDLQDALSLYERGEGDEAPGQREAKEMQGTVYELETALEAKNVELNRLEGELESLRLSLKSRRDGTSPRTPGSAGRTDSGSHQEVEAKLRHMADSALRKQAQLEILRAENRALQHQLSTERKRTREAQAMAAATSSSRQSIRGGFQGILGTGEEERGERAYGVRDGPLARFRTPRTWPRSISKVITGMDRFSAQALAFLRREPLLRIVILIYLVAMHIFVYSLLHWHVETVSGSLETPHKRIASSSSGGQMRNAT